MASRRDRGRKIEKRNGVGLGSGAGAFRFLRPIGTRETAEFRGVQGTAAAPMATGRRLFYSRFVYEKRNGPRPPFRFLAGPGIEKPRNSAAFTKSETKRRFLSASLGGSRAAPPRIGCAQEGPVISET
jgi:hypothetical protein